MMARYINCKGCNEYVQQTANSYGEYYESITGTALEEMHCDSCGKKIFVGDECYAAVLLDSVNHFNYPKHHPSAWAENYISIIK